MNLDTFTISALADEFQETIIGGRIQDVIDVDALGIGLEIYANRMRRYLYLSADSHHPRLHLVDAKLRRGISKPTQLGLLLRRYAEGGLLTRVTQPAWERILELEIEARDDRLRIIAELMPRRANILLVQDGIILDCLKRVGPEENRYRLSLPNHEYIPPPPIRGQMDPAAVTEADIQNLLASVEKESTQIRRLLPGRILGLSPLLAREIAFRATGDPGARAADADASQFFAAFRDVMAPLLQRQWQPGFGAIEGLPEAFSVFPLTHITWRGTETVSAALQSCLSAITGADAYKEAKKPVQAAIDDTKTKLRAKIESLRRGLRDEGELQRLRQAGELILAYQYALAAGQAELRAHYDMNGPELVVALDPDQSPLENAQAYFRRYEKAKSAAEALPALIRETRLELDFADQLESDLEAAANWPEIDDVIQILQSRGHWVGARLKRIGGGGRGGPLRLVSRDGYVIWVGRNSRQNEQVTFKTAKAGDIWLHARDVPGAHVVIRNDGRRISDTLITEAAAVAAWYSKRRSDVNVPVDYTRVKYVKAIKGAGPGMVSYRSESTLSVQPHDESILN
ncbi:MAG: NFACT family protein [Chloroflexota bacterium]|nr:NFACT family protein [Chloroflexota bacterium]MDE2908923.1 NFACT family protein [Chloroflexota bacterium]